MCYHKQQSSFLPNFRIMEEVGIRGLFLFSRFEFVPILKTRVSLFNKMLLVLY